MLNQIMVVAINIPDYNMEVKAVASDPDDINVIRIDKFSLLPNITDTLVSSMCDGACRNFVQKLCWLVSL